MATDVTTKKERIISRRWVWTRRIVQTLFLLAFLYLLLTTVQGVTDRFPNILFFSLDPLVGVTSMLASRSWIAPMYLGIVTVVLAIVVGRAWCGWICPMGTILDWAPSHRNRKNPGISPTWSQGKYFMLFAVVIGAALGSLTLVVLDPITLLFRTVASVVLPGLNWLLNSQPFYPQNMILLVVFAAVLGLNAVRSRFWCRYLCPLGGLLGLISKVSFVRHRVDDEKCISCRKCSILCPTGAVKPESNFTADMAECTVCLNCVDGCPTQAISFAKKRKVTQPQDESRRSFLYSLGAAAVLAVFLRFLPATAKVTGRQLRPPGSSEESLYDQCVRCGECMKICPTGVIQLSAAGSLVDLWTPTLNTRLSYCDYSCNSCGVICPTGAITNLPLELKRKTVIGVASVDKTRCVTWTEERNCTVCEEACPVVPEKAIRLGEGGGRGRGGGGGGGGGRHPEVIPDLCIGCGICEHKCPVTGESAIRVLPL